jgi:ABC-2 type transport system ATP-binding protein
MRDVVIETNGLTRDFDRTRAVDGLTLRVPRGIVFGFLGPNGSGKTTTIRMLLGLVAPTSGTAGVLGFDVVRHADQIRASSGALLEYSGLYERLSAEDNLELYGRITRLPAADRRARIEELLRAFGLWDRRKDRAGTWSRGMKQKLAVARALLHHPALIFLDEPTGGLDPVASASLREDLGSLARREGVTIFLTTHNLSEAERLCARVAVIRQGRLLAEGAPAELRRHTGGTRVEIVGRGFGEPVVSTLLGHPSVRTAVREDGRLLLELQRGEQIAPLVSLLVHHGAEIEEVRKGSLNLEEVFLTLVEESRAD